MAVVGMVGVSFVGPQHDIEQVALSLLKMGNFQPMSSEVMMEGHSLGGRLRSFRGNRYEVLLDKLDKLWLLSGLPAPEKPVSEKSPLVSLEQLEHKFDHINRMVEAWNTKLEELQHTYDTWNAMRVFEEAVRETGRTLHDVQRYSYSWVSIGSLSRENWLRLQETSLAAPFLAVPLIEDSERVTAGVFYADEYRSEIEKIFMSVHMQILTAKTDDWAQYENLDQVSYRLESLEDEIRSLRDAPKRFVTERKFELEKFYESVYTMQRIHTLCRRRSEFSGMWLLSGWIPQSDYDRVFAMATKEVPNVMVLAEYGDILEKQGNEIPTLLKNPPLIRRFQEIVRLYSLPSYSELDPTFVVAVSFCLFFGFMFGDVGHGLALIIGSHFLQVKRIMGSAIASVMKIAGTFSIFFGFLYGSVFGSERIIEPLWLSPMSDVNALLPVSIGIGVAFLTIAICFRVQNCIRREEWGEALFSPEGLAGLLFYWMGMMQIIALSRGAQEQAFEKDIFITIMVVLFILMIFGNGIAKYLFHGERVDEGGVVHVFSVFHAILNFISNTASFVRLAAFALNHAGLSAAVFTLGQMVDNVPGGMLFHALVVLAGQLIIIGLEGMIVFIQTLRLEYYEFFGKFYSGGGKEFTPVLWQRYPKN